MDCGALTPHGLRPGLRRLAVQSGCALVMDPADRRTLIDYYRDDIQDLAALLQRDLSAWLR